MFSEYPFLGWKRSGFRMNNPQLHTTTWVNLQKWCGAEESGYKKARTVRSFRSSTRATAAPCWEAPGRFTVRQGTPGCWQLSNPSSGRWQHFWINLWNLSSHPLTCTLFCMHILLQYFLLMSDLIDHYSDEMGSRSPTTFYLLYLCMVPAWKWDLKETPILILILSLPNLIVK